MAGHDSLQESIERNAPIMVLYDRVHAELDEGKEWDDIDHGLTGEMTYNNWLAYMQECITIAFREAVTVNKMAKR